MVFKYGKLHWIEYIHRNRATYLKRRIWSDNPSEEFSLHWKRTNSCTWFHGSCYFYRYFANKIYIYVKWDIAGSKRSISNETKKFTETVIQLTLHCCFVQFIAKHLSFSIINDTCSFCSRLRVRHVSKRGRGRQSLWDPFPRNQQQNGELPGRPAKPVYRTNFILARFCPSPTSPPRDRRSGIKWYLLSVLRLRIRRRAELIFRIIEKHCRAYLHLTPTQATHTCPHATTTTVEHVNLTLEDEKRFLESLS